MQVCSLLHTVYDHFFLPMIKIWSSGYLSDLNSIKYTSKENVKLLKLQDIKTFQRILIHLNMFVNKI